ncbi:hypothetical protein CONPUDRAFT_138221 [Coniophora puteana RWD-64-598 SS2]|uniref:N-acetyltransferase domain-containing protein n=1 Tax=Coniophora puteana (strain RWD-64-598) TaxID=741705 RepID=A0A5M3MIZ8_CONPW|nr:uncharacterized protein CONPUDRAFT_138221 [Coniophora puteana RWD-64-598 SS2]EIW78957.1 hypothetical protein CONPUDRAFT_138221 [Coniophora puteana RWD-64-598 SS2]
MAKLGKLEWDDDSSDEYIEEHRRHMKRRKVEVSEVALYGRAKNIASLFLTPLPDLLGAPDKPCYAEDGNASGQPPTVAFDELISPLLSELKAARQHEIDREGLVGAQGESLRPLRHHEANALLERKEILAPEPAYANGQTPPMMRIVALRKLSLERERRRAHVSGPNLSLGQPLAPPKVEDDTGSTSDLLDKTPVPSVASLSPLPNPLPTLPPPPGVIASLNAIRTTPFSRSFLSRIVGSAEHGVTHEHGGPSALSAVGTVSQVGGLGNASSGAGRRGDVVAADWETRTAWMGLMDDVREHFAFMHPDREQPGVNPSELQMPIAYRTLAATHLPQVNDLLERTFWNGIDVGDALQHDPERCTLVATHGALVVAVVLASAPSSREAYVTYLTVRAGWDGAGIASTLLYHLLALNPDRDVTLHVSANNPAMLLYNRFGFKAEQFVAGFYDAYLHPDSRASKNAMFLRLRR